MRVSLFFRPLAMALALMLAVSCSEPQSRGFSLPDGDADRGLEVFTEFGCPSCHIVPGYDGLRDGGEAELDLVLGGEVNQQKSYGELVTSVINPSHRLSLNYPLSEISTEDGASRMVTVNEALTVADLIDLVAFLEDQYTVIPYHPSTYPPYHYGP